MPVCNWADHSGCKEQEQLEREAALNSGNHGIQIKGPEVHSTEYGLIYFTSLSAGGISFWSCLIMLVILVGCCVVTECMCHEVTRFLHACCNYGGQDWGILAAAARMTAAELASMVTLPPSLPAPKLNNVQSPPKSTVPTLYNPLYSNLQLGGQHLNLSRQAQLALQAVGGIDPEK